MRAVEALESESVVSLVRFLKPFEEVGGVVRGVEMRVHWGWFNLIY